MPHNLSNLSDQEVRYIHGLISLDAADPARPIEEQVEDMMYLRQARTDLTSEEVAHLCQEINSAYHNVACDNPDCPVHHPKGKRHGSHVA